MLVSGRGSNLEACLAAGLDVRVVISNRPDVRALAVATAHGVPAHIVGRNAFTNAHARDAAIGRLLTDAGVELAVLAGYDQLLRPSYFAEFCGRTVNVHPSLLPMHGGAGMVGLAVHRAVIACGDAETGVTIHDVTPDLDAGPILAQARVEVLPGDDAEALAARVLVEEHRLLVETLRTLAVPAPAEIASAQRLRPPGREAVSRHEPC